MQAQMAPFNQTETPNHISPSSPSSSCSSLGDYIGMESCFDLKKSGEEEDYPFWACSGGEGKKKEFRHHHHFPAEKREFPPPIPLLARTENLSAHMPWVLRRYYTDDGRLILREERVKHHEYFKAHRSNGRLTLQLVPLDDEILSPPIVSSSETEIEDLDGDEDDMVDEEVETVSEELSGIMLDNEVDVDEESVRIDGSGYENSVAEKSGEDDKGSGVGTLGSNGGGGGGKCLDYSKLSSTNSSCFMGRMAFPAMRPVHS